MTLGAFVSSATAGLVAARFGRKACLWSACLGCAVSNIIMMTTTDINALYVGRLLNGLANGYFMTFSQLFIRFVLSSSFFRLPLQPKKLLELLVANLLQYVRQSL